MTDSPERVLTQRLSNVVASGNGQSSERILDLDLSIARITEAARTIDPVFLNSPHMLMNSSTPRLAEKSW